FFENGDLRSRAMASALLQALENRKAKVAVLVTGGSHAPEMEKILASPSQNSKWAMPAVVTLAPKITKIQGRNGTEYLSVFTQEKTPLEKLFNGEKLFISEEVAA